MTDKTWWKLRTLLLGAPVGVILALLVIYRKDVPWWIPGLMLVHIAVIGWLIWYRMANKVKADRDGD